MDLTRNIASQVIDEVSLSKLKRRHRFELAGVLDDAALMANWMASASLYQSANAIDCRASQLDSITAEGIRAAGHALFRPKHLSVVTVGTLSASQQEQIRTAVSSSADTD